MPAVRLLVSSPGASDTVHEPVGFSLAEPDTWGVTEAMRAAIVDAVGANGAIAGAVLYRIALSTNTSWYSWAFDHLKERVCAPMGAQVSSHVDQNGVSNYIMDCLEQAAQQLDATRAFITKSYGTPPSGPQDSQDA